ncbi:hemerythrin domain-containing protein [Sphingomonas montanisoli]|uniref:Hemerythrin domain-containing protein n=1 Tax=Sphingomonas montanisoli TaxID=2606412 RepID=A0A5D9C3W2_9SPHN|nr:hemerythrin domain-containing protein [Sphingomonas montanisoli]
MRHSASSARQRVETGAAAVGRTAGDAYDATRKRAGRAASATKNAATSRTAVVLGAAAAGLVTGLAVNLGRKVAVQAPSVMAGDWFEAIKLEHKMALALFDAIEATTEAEPAKRAMLLIQLTHALSKHAFTEENVIYPALRDWGDKADADKLTHDHGYVKQHLYDLDAIDPASAAFFPKIAAFRADLEAHIAEEEQAIFPPLHAGLDEIQNGRITALANKEGFKLA